MRRSLVLTDETARHRFLAGLPPQVRQGPVPAPAQRTWGLSAEDLRLFLMSYCACLMAVTAFIV